MAAYHKNAGYPVETLGLERTFELLDQQRERLTGANVVKLKPSDGQ
jgi:hypothetical protein